MSKDTFIGSLFAALFLGTLFGTAIQPPQPVVTAIPTIQEQSYGSDWMQAAVEPPTSAYKHVTCKGSYQCRLMATALVYEARGESTRGTIAVAYVIMTRVESPKWPNTIAGVIHQKRKGVCQFSYLCQKPQFKPVAEDWERAYEVSYDVINKLVDNTAPLATHYHTTAVRPYWSKKLPVVTRIGEHIFYGGS
jgi:spore germination cell wall hydrolase CwlJ-like protein